MKNQIDIVHRFHNAVIVPHIPQIERYLGIPQGIAHFILLFFVAGKDPDLTDVSLQESTQHGVPEGARSTRNKNYFIRKHTDLLLL